MPVDKGGLDYTIEVRDEFARPLGRFRRDVDSSREAFEKLKASMRTPIGDGGAAQQVRKVATATDAAAKASVRRSNAVKQETRQQQNQVRAFRELNRESRRREVNEVKALQSSRRNFRFQRQVISATQARALAEQRVTSVQNKRLVTEKLLDTLRKRGLDTERAIRKELGLITEREKRLEKIQRSRKTAVDRLRAAQKLASNERLIQLRAEAAALDRINRDRIKEATAAALTRAGRPDLIPGFKPEEPQKSLTFFQRLQRVLGDTDVQANRVAFTFRRLFGILAAFTIAREVVSGFGRLVRTIVEANAQIETAEIGIASLLTAVGDIRNVSGEAVTGLEALRIAQAEARKQTRLLRLESLQTTASFEELAEAFQVGLGPGLRAGLDINQVRQFTRQISLAASAIGLEQRQLAEEIRSILSGTINVRQTRIAAVLGITNQDIAQAREAGRLFDFLQERFVAFEVAGVEAADTFNGLVARARDSVRVLLAEGGVQFFETLKDLFRDVISSVQTIDSQTGQLQLNPRLLRSVAILASGLSDAVRYVREFAREAGFEGLEVLASSISANIAIAARVLSSFGAGIADILKLFSGLLRIITSIGRAIDKAFSFIGISPVENIVRLAGQIFGTVLAIQLVLVVFGPLLRGIVALAVFINLTLVKTRQTITKIQQGIITIRALMLSANIPLLIAVAIIGTLLVLTGALNFTMEKISGLLTKITGPILNDLDRQVQDIIARADKSTEGFVFGTLESLDKIRESIKSISDEIEGLRASTAASLSVVVENSNLGADFNANDQVASLLASFRTLSDDARKALRDSRSEMDDLGLAIERVTEKLKENDKAIQDITPLEVYSEGQFNRDTSQLDELKKQLFSVSAELQLAQRQANLRAQDTLDVPGLTLRQDDLATQQRINELTERERKLKAQISAIETPLFRDRKRLTQEQKQLEAELTALAERRQILFEESNRLQAAFLDKQILLAREELRRLNAILTEENLRSAISRTFAADLAAARLRNDAEQERLLLLRQEREEIRLTNELDNQATENSLIRLNALKEELQVRIAGLEAIDPAERTADDNESLREAIVLRGQINRQIDLQTQKIQNLNAIFSAENMALTEEIERQAIRSSGSLREQFLVAIEDIARLAPSRFETIFDSIRTVISEFTSFVSSSIASAFNPNNDTSIRERFSRFLESLAQQIISTLLQIAISAIILDSLSGGILRTLLGGVNFANAGVGKAEGGRIDEATRRKARPSERHLRSPRGRHAGGTGRPKGLHPSDTIPIWVAQNEWVIRARSAAKAGHDAMVRLNDGRFDPGRLRAALGLGDGPARTAVSMASKGEGMVSGGRVRRAVASSEGQQAPGVALALMAPSEEAARRLFSGGGRRALLDAISEDAALVRARLGL